MKVRPFHFTLVLVAAAMACAPAEYPASSSTQAPCTLAAADIDAIHEMSAALEAQALAADWEAILTSYSPDVVSMAPNQAAIVGHEALLAYVKALPGVAEYKLTFAEVDGCGDLAYVRGHYSRALQPAESANSSGTRDGGSGSSERTRRDAGS